MSDIAWNDATREWYDTYRETGLEFDNPETLFGRTMSTGTAVMANDPTVKAGSWGARTVEKMVRSSEYALRHELPIVQERGP